MRKCGLHPLIHTLLDFNLAQNIECKKSGAEAPQGSLEINSKKLSGVLKRCHHIFLILKGR
jgi:hypothetical protein